MPSRKNKIEHRKKNVLDRDEFDPKHAKFRVTMFIDFPSRKLIWGTDLQKQFSSRKRVEQLAIFSCSEKANKKYFVDVTVNTVAGRFYLDTGGQRSVMMRDFATGLSLAKGVQSGRQGVSSKRIVETVSAQLGVGKLRVPLKIDIEPNNWLLLSVWAGLPPSEIDRLKQPGNFHIKRIPI